MKLLMYSREQYFVEIFSSYLSVKRPKLEVLCYTLEAAAEEDLQWQSPNVVLCEEDSLTEFIGTVPYIALGSNTAFPDEKGVGALNIYQKAEQILEDLDRILALCGGEVKVAGDKSRDISVYSTEGGAGKTTLAYLTAMQSAKHRKTAYLSLEPLACTDNLFRLAFPHTMEQFLYAQKSGANLDGLLYETLMQTEENVYVLPVMQSLGDYRDVDVAAVKELCVQLHKTGIEWVILDVPTGFGGFCEGVLEFSDRIVWVYSDSVTGRAKETKVKNDPYLKQLLVKSRFCRNRCVEKKYPEGVIATFPVSNTLREAERISRVLEVNEAFQNGCAALEAALDERQV